MNRLTKLSLSSMMRVRFRQTTIKQHSGEQKMTKCKGAGIMVSDFIEEHNAYLRLTDAIKNSSSWNKEICSKTS